MVWNSGYVDASWSKLQDNTNSDLVMPFAEEDGFSLYEYIWFPSADMIDNLIASGKGRRR